MTTNNILLFPKDKIVREAINDVEDLKKAQEKSVRNYADTTVDELTNLIIGEIDNYGLEREEDAVKRDLHFALTVLSAAVYRSLKIHHEMHPFLDDYVKTVEMILKETTEDTLDI